MSIRANRTSDDCLPKPPSLPMRRIIGEEEAMHETTRAPASLPRLGRALFVSMLFLAGVVEVRAQAPEADKEPVLSTLTLDAAIRWSLEHNPEIMALRQQHGIAAAGIVIAYTYPF